MYWLLLTLSVLAAVHFTLASPISARWDETQVKHVWNTVPKNWECQGYPPEETTIDLRIALKPDNENALVDALYEISDPNHPKYVFFPSPHVYFTPTLLGRYRMHLSKEEVAELVGPHPNTLELVNSWFAYHDIPSSFSPTHGGNWLTLLDLPVSKANDLLDASYQLYRHAETNETVLRTISYSVPAALHKLVQTVAPTTYFGSPRAMRQTSHLNPNAPTLPYGDQELREAVANAKPGSAATVPASCANTTTPACLRALYNTETYVPAATSNNKLGIAGYLEEYASQADLTKFMTLFHPEAATAKFTVVQVNGGSNNQSDPGVEVSNHAQNSAQNPAPLNFPLT
jgi:tripeptidyl-peptidase-1